MQYKNQLLQTMYVCVYVWYWDDDTLRPKRIIVSTILAVFTASKLVLLLLEGPGYRKSAD